MEKEHLSKVTTNKTYNVINGKVKLNYGKLEITSNNSTKISLSAEKIAPVNLLKVGHSQYHKGHKATVGRVFDILGSIRFIEDSAETEKPYREAIITLWGISERLKERFG